MAASSAPFHPAGQESWRRSPSAVCSGRMPRAGRPPSAKPLDLAAAWHGAQPSPANLNKNQIAAHTDPFCAPLLDGTEETAAAHSGGSGSGRDNWYRLRNVIPERCSRRLGLDWDVERWRWLILRPGRQGCRRTTGFGSPGAGVGVVLASIAGPGQPGSVVRPFMVSRRSQARSRWSGPCPASPDQTVTASVRAFGRLAGPGRQK